MSSTFAANMACTCVGSDANNPAMASPVAIWTPGTMPMHSTISVSTADAANTRTSRFARAASRARRPSSIRGASSGMISAEKARSSKTCIMSSTLATVGSNTTTPVLFARLTAQLRTPSVLLKRLSIDMAQFAQCIPSMARRNVASQTGSSSCCT